MGDGVVFAVGDGEGFFEFGDAGVEFLVVGQDEPMPPHQFSLT